MCGRVLRQSAAVWTRVRAEGPAACKPSPPGQPALVHCARGCAGRQPEPRAPVPLCVGISAPLESSLCRWALSSQAVGWAGQQLGPCVRASAPAGAPLGGCDPSGGCELVAPRICVLWGGLLRKNLHFVYGVSMLEELWSPGFPSFPLERSSFSTELEDTAYGMFLFNIFKFCLVTLGFLCFCKICLCFFFFWYW